MYKIIAIQTLFLMLALMSIGVTLLVSWELEGGAAAINDAGSLRMQAWRMAFLLADRQAELASSERAELATDIGNCGTEVARVRPRPPR